MRKRRNRLGVRLDMTPMVDVAFLLLTFFMLTTQFRPPETLPIELPGSKAQTKIPASNVLSIAVATDGGIFISAEVPPGTSLPGGETGLVRDLPVTLQELPLVLIRLRSANPRLQTVIRADRNGSYGPVEDVMKALQTARIFRFALVTNLEREV